MSRGCLDGPVGLLHLMAFDDKHAREDKLLSLLASTTVCQTNGLWSHAWGVWLTGRLVSLCLAAGDPSLSGLSLDWGCAASSSYGMAPAILHYGVVTSPAGSWTGGMLA